MGELELTEAVDLCDAGGRLNPGARGWSRVPLHRCNLSRAWGRKKRWDYWAVLADDLYLSLTYADIDYAGTASLWIHQPSTGLTIAHDQLIPFGRGFALPDEPCTGRMVFDQRGLRVEIDGEKVRDEKAWLAVGGPYVVKAGKRAWARIVVR